MIFYNVSLLCEIKQEIVNKIIKDYNIINIVERDNNSVIINFTVI